MTLRVISWIVLSSSVACETSLAQSGDNKEKQVDDETPKRINIEDLRKAEEELTDEEAKKVQGGFYGTGVYKAIDARTSTGNTIGGSLSNDPSNPSRKMGDGSV